MINHDLLKSNNSTRFKIDRKEAEKYIYERDRERMHIVLYLQWEKKLFQVKNICNGKKIFSGEKSVCCSGNGEKYGCRSSGKH